MVLHDGQRTGQSERRSLQHGELISREAVTRRLVGRASLNLSNRSSDIRYPKIKRFSLK